jgi:hypothetical protein
LRVDQISAFLAAFLERLTQTPSLMNRWVCIEIFE